MRFEEVLNLTINGGKWECQPIMPVEILVNGEMRTIGEGQTVLELLHDLELDPARVAVELNRRIVKQPLWANTQLEPGARVEIVQFVGGG
jgi:sulfur carrier protein